MPHGLHFNDVEHIDYTALADRDAGLAVQSSSADTQAAESPMHAGSPQRPNKSSLLGAVVGNSGRGDGGARNEGGGSSHRGAPAVLWLAIISAWAPDLSAWCSPTYRSASGTPGSSEPASFWSSTARSQLARCGFWYAAFTFVAAAVTVYYAPQAASTGIPETKAFLNGCDVRARSRCKRSA